MVTHLECRFIEVITDTVHGKTIKYERYLVLSPDSLAGQTFVVTLHPDSNITYGEINGNLLRIVGMNDRDSHVFAVE